MRRPAGDSGGPRRRDLPWHLAFVFVLAGAAVALAFVTLATAAAPHVLDPPTPARVGGFVAVFVLAVTAVGLPPQLRQVEGVMATGLLGADVGGPPGPARTWEETLGSVVWFWLHVLAGAVNGAALVVLGAGGALATVGPFVLDPGTRILGLSALAVTGSADDVRLVLLGPVMVALCFVMALVSAHGLRRLAPRLLGPSLESRLLQLQRATDAVGHRQLLARELHDSLGHSLSAIVIQSALARRTFPTAHPATPALDDVEQAARSALDQLDSFLGRLRADEAEAEVRPASGPGLDDLAHLVSVAEAAGHQVTTDVETLDLPPVVSQEAYRVLQESVTNAIRHAPGAPLHIEVRRDGRRLVLRVANALPADAEAAEVAEGDAARSGRGLLGVRERVASLGGRVSIGAEAGRWTVDVAVPLARPERSLLGGTSRRRGATTLGA